jgi:hypothetical protein
VFIDHHILDASIVTAHRETRTYAILVMLASAVAVTGQLLIGEMPATIISCIPVTLPAMLGAIAGVLIWMLYARRLRTLRRVTNERNRFFMSILDACQQPC